MNAQLDGLAQDTFVRDDKAASLVEKYRPRCLAELLGQPDVRSALETFVTAPYPAAMLFVGETGMGKTSAAYALAYELGCLPEDGELGGLYEIPSGSQTADSVRET